MNSVTNEFDNFLEKDEKIIWSGRPKKGVVFRPADLFLIPFSLLWLGGVSFWFITAFNQSPSFSLFGIPFILIGLLFTFGRFIIDIKQRERIHYAITNDRIIIKSGYFKSSIKSLQIKSLSNIIYNERNDGSGSIEFGPKNPLMIWGSGMNWFPGVEIAPSFEEITEVRKVYKYLTELQIAL
jgi:hypothetical protein